MSNTTEKAANKHKDLQPDENWRMTKLYDVIIAGSGVVLFLLFLVNNFVNPKDTPAKTAVFAALWLALLLVQTRTYLAIYHKYRNKEYIRRGFFGNVMENRKK